MGFEIDDAPVSFSFAISQPVRATIHAGKSQIIIERKAGDSLFAYLPGSRGKTEIPPGHFSGLSIHIGLPIFHELFPHLPDSLNALKTGGTPRAVHHISPMSWETRFALGQVLNCPYAGDARRVFFEAKALELITRNIAAMSGTDSGQGLALNTRDLECTREAHHILLERIEDPPGLQALSTMVGMNRNKLNQGFRQLYGATVFSVLRETRFTTALALLRETELSLSEIALRAGYSDQANFSNAFRRRFGLSPKRLREKGGRADRLFPGSNQGCCAKTGGKEGRRTRFRHR